MSKHTYKNVLVAQYEAALAQAREWTQRADTLKAAIDAARASHRGAGKPPPAEEPPCSPPSSPSSPE